MEDGPRRALVAAWADGVSVLDGAMGTALIARGADPADCLERLCHTRPTWVTGIHRAYLRAGAQAILTHTFGANRFRLRRWQLQDGAVALNHRAVHLARQAIQETGHGAVPVLGCLGPTGLAPSQLECAGDGAVLRAFSEQVSALVEAGADGLLLETFTSPAELRLALHAAADVAVPRWVSVVPDGACAETSAELLHSALTWGADAVGLNCGADTAAFDLVFAELSTPDMVRFARPSAGLPVSGSDAPGATYPIDPPGFGELAERLFELGCCAVGGCCGTTPAHIAAVADAAARAKPAPAADPSQAVGPVAAAGEYGDR